MVEGVEKNRKAVELTPSDAYGASSLKEGAKKYRFFPRDFPRKITFYKCNL